jgi:hypothetical protein
MNVDQQFHRTRRRVRRFAERIISGLPWPAAVRLSSAPSPATLAAGANRRSVATEDPGRYGVPWQSAPADLQPLNCPALREHLDSERPPELVGENGEASLSSFEVTPPHSLEQGDRRQRGQRVEASDENEHCRPTPRLLLQKGCRRAAEDRADTLSDVKVTIIAGSEFRPKGVGKR